MVSFAKITTIDSLAAFRHQRKRALLFLAPIPSDERVREMLIAYRFRVL